MSGRHAGLGRRLGARSCDFILLAWLWALFGVEIGFSASFVALIVVISFVLEVPLVVARGLTFGKVLLRVRVVDHVDDGPVGVVAAMLRWLVLYGPLLIPVVRFLSLAVELVLVVVHGRGLHDFAARTIVIPIDDSEGAPEP